MEIDCRKNQRIVSFDKESGRYLKTYKKKTLKCFFSTTPL